MAQYNSRAFISKLQTTVAVGQSLRAEGDGLLPVTLSSPGKDPLGFTLQLASLLFGPEFVETQCNQLLRRLSGTVAEPSELERLLKGDLYRLCVGGLGNQLIPADFATVGYQLPVRLLDLFELFRVEPGSPEGKVRVGAFERAIVENVLRRPGIAQRLPSIPYLTFTADARGEVVTVKFDATAGPAPTPTRLVDLFAEIIYAPGFRLLDPGRLALDALDAVLGATAANRARRGVERELLVAGWVEAMSAQNVSEEVMVYSAPALAGVRNAAQQQQQGLLLDVGCDPLSQPISPEDLVVPLIPGTQEPDFEAAYRTVTVKNLVLGDQPDVAAPVRDAIGRKLIKALVLVILRNTVLAPRVWALIVLSRIFRVGYPQTGYNEFISRTINDQEFHELLQPTRPLLETATKAISKAAIDYLTERLLKELEKHLAPLLKQVGLEQVQGFERLLTSLLPIR